MCYLIAPRDGIASFGQARRDGRDGAVRFGRYPAHVVVAEHVQSVNSSVASSIPTVVVVVVVPVDVGVSPEGIPEGFA